MVNSKLPSYNRYPQQGGLYLTKMTTWYLGVCETNPNYMEILRGIEELKPFSLIEDKEMLDKYKTYLDVSKIPDEYKSGNSYYSDYEKNKDTIYLRDKLDNANIFLKDSSSRDLAKKLFSRDISPLFAERKYLVGLPKAYFVIFEWDQLKDEGLLYAERLREAGVEVRISFYENAFHGMANQVDKINGFQKSRDIQKDLIDYLKSNI